MSNTSTIEVWEKEKVEGMMKKGKIRKVKVITWTMEIACSFFVFFFMLTTSSSSLCK